MNKQDINEIPEKFHILFNSDWNIGEDSTMRIYDRMECNNLFLEYNKWRIQQAIKKSIPTEDDVILGFVKD